MSHLDEWHPLSSRYGYSNREAWDADFTKWESRHSLFGESAPDAKRCACPGSPLTGTCRLPLTQEDLLCDECRLWCVAVDDAGKDHHLVNLYPPKQVAKPGPIRWLIDEVPPNTEVGANGGSRHVNAKNRPGLTEVRTGAKL